MDSHDSGATDAAIKDKAETFTFNADITQVIVEESSDVANLASVSS